MQPLVRSTNLARPKPEPSGKPYVTGIDKRPVAQIEVTAPADGYGHGSGAQGDHIGDVDHHGGAQKAVYAFSREELDRWAAELERELTDGIFGENLTTEGVDLEALLINQQLRIGAEVVLEVSVPRTPCATFAAHLGVRGWAKQFARHGRCGVYLRVVRPGVIRAGDPIEVQPAPDHGVDMRTAFAAALGNDEAALAVVKAACLPPLYHERLAQRLSR